MNRSKLSWGVICLILAGIIAVLSFTLPLDSMIFYAGEQNLRWVPAVVLAIVGIVLLAIVLTLTHPGGFKRTPPVKLRSRSQGRPTPIWSISERGAYWVRTATSVRPELTAFERAKSMIRYFPPNGTPGFARSCDRIESRSPSPPARTRVRIAFDTGRFSHARPHRQRRGRWSG